MQTAIGMRSASARLGRSFNHKAQRPATENRIAAVITTMRVKKSAFTLVAEE